MRGRRSRSGSARGLTDLARLARALLVALAFWSVVVCASPIVSAQAASTGQISGAVTDVMSHAAIANATVVAYSAGDVYSGSSPTNSQGQYTITGLAPGSYRLQFYASGYLSAYYNGASTLSAATAVVVSAGQTTANINQALQFGGQISGTVTDAATGTPEAGIDVEIFSAATTTTTTVSGSVSGFGPSGPSGPVLPRIPSGTYEGSAQTGLGGHYTVSDLAAGSYVVEFVPARNQAYGVQYYNDHATFGAAGAVAVTAGMNTTGINASLRRQGVISGTVTAAGSHLPLDGIDVEVYDSAGNPASTYYAQTDASGDYTVAGLLAGSYTVGFFNPGSGSYAPQYYNGQGAPAAPPRSR